MFRFIKLLIKLEIIDEVDNASLTKLLGYIFVDNDGLPFKNIGQKVNSIPENPKSISEKKLHSDIKEQFPAKS